MGLHRSGLYGGVAPAALATALIVAAPAMAGWTSAITLTSPGAKATLPTVASDGRGDVVAAWYSLRRRVEVIVVRTSSDGGRSWRAPQSLGPALIAKGGNRPALVRAAVGPGGEPAVVWQRPVGGGGQRIAVAMALRGRGFGPTRIASPAGVNAFYPDVAVDGSGRAAVVWVTPTTVERALVAPRGIVSPARVLAQAQGDLPTVAADSRGELAYAWVEMTTTTPPRTPLLVAQESPGGVIGPALTVSPNGADLPQLAMSSSGATTVAWPQTNGVAPPMIDAASVARSGRFAIVQRLSRPGALAILGGGAAGSRGIGVDAAGRVSVIWVEVPAAGGSGRSRARVATGNGRFGAPRTLQTLNGSTSMERPAIAVASGGRAIATWTTLNLSGANLVWGTASRAPGGTFASPLKLSGPFGDDSADAATSASGAGVAVWSQDSGLGPIRAARWMP